MSVYWLSWSSPHTVPSTPVPENIVVWRKGWTKASTTYCARIETDVSIDDAWILLATYYHGANLSVRHMQEEHDADWWPHPKRYPLTGREAA